MNQVGSETISTIQHKWQVVGFLVCYSSASLLCSSLLMDVAFQSGATGRAWQKFVLHLAAKAVHAVAAAAAAAYQPCNS
jgi:hypothetical protein